ncbi:FGGY family carbohydrate kinase [Aureimonas populi]|uniref:FGGY family carbohydrate kinase n=1 Tax=Aureimonas populi TaxID=1701758 RepID=A0ABW5CH60_9HYPH|nr:FGGY family carbohydrate kinase [Aureimonas populi]
MRVAAIDQGTTSTRCLVIEDGGRWRLAGARRHAQHHPAPGRVEHDPRELLADLRAVLAAAGPVDAIALANQGESCLAWDAVDGEPLSPVIVWQDARTARALAGLGPDAQARSRAICGLPLDPYFSAGKLGWLVANCPAVAAARRAGRLRLGTTDAFFLDRLAGTFATDAATASRTGLLDPARMEWSAELCQMHGVPIECLPPIRAVNAGFGEIGGVRVAVSIVDQQAALYGHGCRAPGEAKITFGTGAFLLAIAGPARPAAGELLPTIAWQMRGQAPVHAIEGGVYDAGACLEWVRRLGLFSADAQLDGFEGPSALSRGIVFVPALSGLAAPHWDRGAAPLFIGMDHATGPRDLVRAVLEGIALMTSELVDAAAGRCALSPRLSIDGGLSQSAFFARFLADACARTIVVPPMHELTALGLAELCGVEAAPLRAGAREHAPATPVPPGERDRFREAVRRARHWR